MKTKRTIVAGIYTIVLTYLVYDINPKLDLLPCILFLSYEKLNMYEDVQKSWQLKLGIDIFYFTILVICIWIAYF